MVNRAAHVKVGDGEYIVLDGRIQFLSVIICHKIEAVLYTELSVHIYINIRIPVIHSRKNAEFVIARNRRSCRCLGRSCCIERGSSVCHHDK